MEIFKYIKKFKLIELILILSIISSSNTLIEVTNNVADANYKGWIKNNKGQWYYVYPNTGSLARNKWIGNYYLGSDGLMLTESWTPDGYYVDSNGKWVPNKKKEKIKLGWQKDSVGRWYYYESNGALAKNVWKGNYYLGSDGVMLINTWTPDGYYVDNTGKWVPNKKKEEIKPGWQKDSVGRWYYYESNGALAKNVWKGNYYLGSDGVMLINTWTPDGYYVDNTGKWIPNKKKEEVFSVKHTSKNNYIKYYSQNDPYWAKKTYGIGNMHHTGCVPTALAMIISTLKYDISPDKIAYDLYKNTNYFNVKDIGTSALGTSYILKKYGFNYRLIYSLDQLKLELGKGKIVYAAVANKPFTVNGYTHAILLRGIDSLGNTTVYNPYSKFGSKKSYNITQIWDQRSRIKDDNELGSPFIVIDA